MIDATEYINLLKEMVSIPAASREEEMRADFLEAFIRSKGWNLQRMKNNLLIQSGNRRKTPALLLNSHIDTVAPSEGWKGDPFIPLEKDGELHGLGTNDAGASVVSLLAVYDRLVKEKHADRVTVLLSAEEEVSGDNGLALMLPELDHIGFALVGEPTGMQPAVAERGLVVIDAIARGESGHAARGEGINAIYMAMEDIAAIRALRFERKSEWLDAPSVNVTMIGAGKNHNVVPDRCTFVIDARSNDVYSNEILYEMISSVCRSGLKPRSMHLRSSGLPSEHAAFRVFKEMNMVPFGSSTLSDMARMPFPSVKIGPGDSSRSHSADEYIRPSEIKQAIEIYDSLIRELLNTIQ